MASQPSIHLGQVIRATNCFRGRLAIGIVCATLVSAGLAGSSMAGETLASDDHALTASRQGDDGTLGGSYEQTDADAQLAPPSKPPPPNPPTVWRWEIDADFAAGRRLALNVLDGHGGVTTTESKFGWWNLGRVHERPVPASLAASRVRQLVKSVKFCAGTLPGAPAEENGVVIPKDADEVCDVPEDVDDELLLTHLPYLPDCRLLALELTSVTDDGLAVLDKIPFLDALFLEYSWSHRYPVLIGDSGMSHIGRHPGLTRLMMSGMPVTDKGMVEVSKCKTLRDVSISCCPITPACFLSLKDLPNLVSLTIRYSPDFVVPKKFSPDFSQEIDDDVAEAVASLDGRLEFLIIEGIQVHPSLLRAIAKIESLGYYRGPDLPKRPRR